MMPAIPGRDRTPSICVVEDEPSIASLVGKIAGRTGLPVHVSTSARAALARAESEQITLVIADVHIPDLNGHEFVRRLRARGVDCPVLFISGDVSIEMVDGSLAIAGASFLPKPFNVTELQQAIWSALRQR